MRRLSRAQIRESLRAKRNSSWGQMTKASHLSHRSVVLYHASIERLNEAQRAFASADYLLAIYLSGLGVECILQALASLAGAQHDAHHDLPRWLSKCPESLRESVKGNAGASWSQLVAIWHNGLRYFSDAALLGYLRERKATRGIAGGPKAIVRENARRVVQSAAIIHTKGVSQWLSSTKN